MGVDVGAHQPRGLGAESDEERPQRSPAAAKPFITACPRKGQWTSPKRLPRSRFDHSSSPSGSPGPALCRAASPLPSVLRTERLARVRTRTQFHGRTSRKAQLAVRAVLSGSLCLGATQWPARLHCLFPADGLHGTPSPPGRDRHCFWEARPPAPSCAPSRSPAGCPDSCPHRSRRVSPGPWRPARTLPTATVPERGGLSTAAARPSARHCSLPQFPRLRAPASQDGCEVS